VKKRREKLRAGVKERRVDVEERRGEERMRGERE